MLSMLLRRFAYVVGALVCAAGVMVPAFADDDIFAGTPAENTKAFSVTNAGNTHIVFSSTTRMLFARCVNDTAVQVFIVNQNDASTAAGVGPYCSTCDLGPTLPPVGDAFLRAGAAGPADVRCGFVESWPGAMGMGGGGGMSLGAADTRYLKLDASNDPLTGQLNGQQASCAAPGYSYSGVTNAGTSFDGTNLNLCMNGAAVVQGSTSGIAILSPVQSTNPPFTVRTLQSSGTSARWFSIGSSGTEELGLYNSGSTIGAAAGRTILDFTNNGSLVTGDGTAAFPAYAFVSENGTGMRRSAAGVLTFATSGTDRASLSSASLTSTVPFKSSAASEPQYQASADATTGIGIVTGRVDIIEGGATQAAFDGSTATVSAPLREADGAVGAPSYSFTNGTGDGFWKTGGVDRVNVSLNGTAIAAWTGDQYRVDSAGTTSSQSLEVSRPSGSGELLGAFTTNAASTGQILVDLGTNNASRVTIDMHSATDGEVRQSVTQLGYQSSYVASTPAALPTCTSTIHGTILYKEDIDTAGTNAQLCLCARNNGALTYAWIAIGGSLTGTCT